MGEEIAFENNEFPTCNETESSDDTRQMTDRDQTGCANCKPVGLCWVEADAYCRLEMHEIKKY